MAKRSIRVIETDLGPLIVLDCMVIAVTDGHADTVGEYGSHAEALNEARGLKDEVRGHFDPIVLRTVDTSWQLERYELS